MITIDKDWLAARKAPYVLDHADEVYLLVTDFATLGTAFVIGAANIVLDLNGYKVTYGNSLPIEVPNGGFEEMNLGWDISKCPSAIRVSAKLGMFGATMLRLPDFTTTQLLTSAPIQIPQAGREYMATITPSGNMEGIVVWLRVIDTSTGTVLASAKSASVAAGYCPVATFTPVATNPILLQIEITPPLGKTATVDLDNAAVYASRDFGIVSCGEPSGFPLQLAAFKTAAKRAVNCTIKNGCLIQGSGRGYASHAIYGYTAKGIKVGNVTLFVNGMDTAAVEGLYSTDPFINDCKIICDVERISNRMKIFAAISLKEVKGRVQVYETDIQDCPQIGIAVANNSLGTVSISDNYVCQRAVAANPYGIVVSGVTDFQIYGNTIRTDNGRGISLDGWNAATPMRNGHVVGNHIEVSQRPNLEYPTLNGQSATALRIRNWGAVQQNLHIHDNVFIATTGEGMVEGAIACRLTQDNKDGLNTAANNLLENNTFTATVTTTDPKHFAYALSIAGVDAGTGLQINRNTLESNDVALNIGDSDSWQAMNVGVTLAGNTLKKSAEGAVRPYATIQAGSNRNGCRDIQLIDTKYDGGAVEAVRFINDKNYPAPKSIQFGHTGVVIDKTLSG